MAAVEAEGVVLERGLAEALRDLLRDMRRNPPTNNAHLPPGPGGRPPIRAILLADLPDGGKADCAVTQLETTNEVQQVEIIGDTISGGTFKLSFKGQTTGDLPFNVSAADMQTALERLGTIGAGNVKVSLGKQTYTNPATNVSTIEFPGVWLVEFIGALAAQLNLPLLTAASSLTLAGTFNAGAAAVIVVATTHWTDSGVVETLNALVPVGNPTPMRSGAVAIGLWFPGIGYAVISCEGRQFTTTYYY